MAICTFLELQDLAARALERAGASPAAAQAAARALVAAEQQGVSSHGVSRIPLYAAHMRNGRVNGAAAPEIVNHQSSALLIDAHYNNIEGMAFDPLPAAADPLGTLGFRARLYKGPGSRGWYTEATGAEDYTVQDLRLDVYPVRMAQPLFQPWKP